MYNPLKKQHLKTTVVFSAFLTAFGFLQFYLYTDSESPLPSLLLILLFIFLLASLTSSRQIRPSFNIRTILHN